ncbi:MAG: hypothetical protein JJU13_01050 [Balneolaceae bacterium]|nr:hypothetical protein [Balneolaceae bacterium]
MNFFNLKIITIILTAGLVWIAAGCAEKSTERTSADTAAVEQVSYGNDICAFNGELIETERYGGRIVMNDGTIHNFMSVECVAGYYLKMEDKSAVESIKITDFVHGKKLMPVDELAYLKSHLRPSPNGMFLSAVDASNEKMKTFVYDAYPGPYLQWDEVLELVSEEWEIGKGSGDLTATN